MPLNFHRMDFLNPVLAPVEDGDADLLSTVRLGRKWFDAVTTGDELALARTNGEVVARATVVDYAYGPFDSIPPRYVRMNHDPACRTREGLEAAMRRAYPDFRPDSLVTVVVFEVVG